MATLKGAGDLPKTLRVDHTTAAEAVQFSTTVLGFSYAVIQAHATNTGAIYIGGSTLAASGSNGFALVAGDGITIGSPREWKGRTKFDFTNFYLSAAVASEGIAVLYFD